MNIFKTWPKLYYIEASLRVGLVERTTFWGSVADLFACDLASELSPVTYTTAATHRAHQSGISVAFWVKSVVTMAR